MSLFSIKINEIYTLVPLFAKIADHRKGICFETTFARNLGVEESESTRRLYKLFDTVSSTPNNQFKNR